MPIPAQQIMSGAISSADIGFAEYSAEDRAQRDCPHKEPLEWLDGAAGVVVCPVCGRVFTIADESQAT
jgi:uncharacterized protein YbaR (Trm112 family)